MISGRKSKKITIEQTSQTINSIGGIVDSWSTFAQPFAKVKPMGGNETFKNRQVNNKNIVMFTINYQSGITSKMRVSYDSRIFDIQSVVNVEERSREIELMCEEDV